MKQLIVLLVLLVLSQQKRDRMPNTVNSHQQIMANIQAEPDRLSLAVVSRTEGCGQKCEITNDVFRDLIKQHEGAINIMYVDCYEVAQNEMQLAQYPICSSNNTYMLPHLTFFTPQGDDQKIKDTIYTGPLTVPLLLKEANRLTPNWRTVIETKRDWKRFLDNQFIENKVLLLNEDIDKTPYFYKALACIYRDKLDFAEIDSDNSKIMKQLKGKYTDFPKMVILKWSNEDKEYLEFVYEEDLNITQARLFLDEIVQNNFLRKDDSFGYLKNKATGLQDITLSGIEPLKDDEKAWSFIQVTDIQGRNHSLTKTIFNQYGMLYTYYNIICESEDCQSQVKQQYGVTEYPSIIIYPFGKNASTPLIFGPSTTLETLEQQTLDQIENSIHPVNDLMMQKWLRGNLDTGKQTAIFKYNSSTYQKIIVRTIAQMEKYQDYFIFGGDGYFTDPSMLNMSSTPFVQMISDISKTKDIFRYDDYKEQTNYEGMVNHLNGYAQIRAEAELKRKPVQEVTTPEEFDQLCKKDGVPCLIAFMDYVKEGKFKILLETYQQLRITYKDRHYNWIYINAKCHGELLTPLNIEMKELPTLAYYDHKAMKYKVLDEKMKEKSMNGFLDDLKNKKKKNLGSLDDDLDMDERLDCDQIIENLKSEYVVSRDEKRKAKLAEQDIARRKMAEDEKNDDL